VTDTYQLQGRRDIRLRKQSSERRNVLIITIVVVYNPFRYVALKVIGRDGDWSPCFAASWALYADGFNMFRDVKRASGRTATLTLSPATTSTGAALLASGISAWWCHDCEWVFGGLEAGGRSEVGCVWLVIG
jgi:hypothetical protein